MCGCMMIFAIIIQAQHRQHNPSISLIYEAVTGHHNGQCTEQVNGKRDNNR